MVVNVEAASGRESTGRRGAEQRRERRHGGLQLLPQCSARSARCARSAATDAAGAVPRPAEARLPLPLDLVFINSRSAPPQAGPAFHAHYFTFSARPSRRVAPRQTPGQWNAPPSTARHGERLPRGSLRERTAIVPFTVRWHFLNRKLSPFSAARWIP